MTVTRLAVDHFLSSSWRNRTQENGTPYPVCFQAIVSHAGGSKVNATMRATWPHSGDSLAYREPCPLHLCHGCAQATRTSHVQLGPQSGIWEPSPFPLGSQPGIQELSPWMGIRTSPLWEHIPACRNCAIYMARNPAQGTRPRIGNTGHPLLTLLCEAQGASIIARLAYVRRLEPTYKFQTVPRP